MEKGMMKEGRKVEKRRGKKTFVGDTKSNCGWYHDLWSLHVHPGRGSLETQSPPPSGPTHSSLGNRSLRLLKEEYPQYQLPSTSVANI